MWFQTPNKQWKGWNLPKTNALNQRKSLSFIRLFCKDINTSKVNNKLKAIAITPPQPPNRSLRKTKNTNKNIKIILGKTKLWDSSHLLLLKYRNSGEFTYSESDLNSLSSPSVPRKSNPLIINSLNWNLTTKKSGAWFSFKKKKSFLELLCSISQNIRICYQENNCWNRTNLRLESPKVRKI